ncbi:MAG: DUF1667 domain-containing protein [Clostridia bacterium]|nr:DUF1667 domain-containing protein [Clostridia bacterium]
MKEYTCIICPKYCRITVDSDLYEFTVLGNDCEKGREYALTEFTNPLRSVTFNVNVIGGNRAVTSVKPSREIPLVKILPLSRLIKKIRVNAPIKRGQTLFYLLGEKIIANQSVAKADDNESKSNGETS